MPSNKNLQQQKSATPSRNKIFQVSAFLIEGARGLSMCQSHKMRQHHRQIAQIESAAT
jgi:hypothetical protein